MDRSKISLFGILALVLTGLMAGCGGTDDSTANTGNGSMQVYITDAPYDAKAVNVTISKLEVSKDGTSWITLNSYAPVPLVLNIIDYRYRGSGTAPARFLLANKTLETGHYNKMRLSVDKVIVVDNLNVSYGCSISDQDKTGIVFDSSFDIAEGAMTPVLIDFDASRSIVQEANGPYRLKSTIRAVPLSLSTNVKGSVSFRNSAGNTIPVPFGVSIAAYTGEQFVASSPVISDGTYYLPAMRAGSYRLELEHTDLAIRDYVIPLTNVNVTVSTTPLTVNPLVAVPVPN